MQHKGTFLSTRSARALEPANSYFQASYNARKDPWSPHNPGGFISLAVAQNKLTKDIMLRDLSAHSSTFPERMLGYQEMRGNVELRTSLAAMMQRTFMKGLTVDPNKLTVLSGCGAVLELLFHLLGDAGDTVLIAAPYYPTFDKDLTARNDLLPVPVYLSPPHQQQADDSLPSHHVYLSPQHQQQADDSLPSHHAAADNNTCRSRDFITRALDEAAAAAALSGHPVRALLMTNPINPLGTLYSGEQLSSIIAWCLRNKVHCVSDEVYANSVFDVSVGSFTSVMQAAAELPGGTEGAELADELVHVVYGLSKDFCASGLRIGCCYSNSSSLNQGLRMLAYFHTCPGPMQWAVAQLLSDEPRVEEFLAVNRERLKKAYSTLSGALDAAGIAYVPATSAIFCWLDLRKAFAGSGRSSSSSSSNHHDIVDDSLNNNTAAGIINTDGNKLQSGRPRSSSRSSSSSSRAPCGSWKDEEDLWNLLVDKHKVVLTPGSSCHAASPGFFRICYASQSTECLPAAVQRIAAAMNDFRQLQHQQPSQLVN